MTRDFDKPEPADDAEASGATDINLDKVSLLVPKAQRGSADAQRELFEHIQGYLSLMAGKANVQHLAAKFGTSDIVQQSLAQVIQGFDDFRGKTTKEFYAWLNQIVANEAKQLQRGFHRDKRDVARERPLAAELSGSQPGFVPVDPQATPRTRALAAEEIQSFYAALDRLEDRDAEVIRLRSLERLSFKEVAARMGRSVDSVTKLWRRALLKLQQEIQTDESQR